MPEVGCECITTLTVNSGTHMISPSDILVAGSVAGGVCRLLTAPLDVLKVRLQLQIEPISKVPHLYIFRIWSIFNSHLLIEIILI